MWGLQKCLQVPSKWPQLIEILQRRAGDKGWLRQSLPKKCCQQRLALLLPLPLRESAGERVYRQPFNRLMHVNYNYQQAPPTDSARMRSWLIDSIDHCLLSKNLLSKQFLPKCCFCRLWENRRLIRAFHLNPSRGTQACTLVKNEVGGYGHDESPQPFRVARLKPTGSHKDLPTPPFTSPIKKPSDQARWGHQEGSPLII